MTSAAGRSVLLHVGARFTFDGEVVEVVQLDGTRISVRDGRDRWRTVSLPVFLSRAAAVDGQTPVPALGALLAGLSAAQRDAVAERARHRKTFCVSMRGVGTSS
jgi:hypothetical protein